MSDIRPRPLPVIYRDILDPSIPSTRDFEVEIYCAARGLTMMQTPFGLDPAVGLIDERHINVLHSVDAVIELGFLTGHGLIQLSYPDIDLAKIARGTMATLIACISYRRDQVSLPPISYLSIYRTDDDFRRLDEIIAALPENAE